MRLFLLLISLLFLSAPVFAQKNWPAVNTLLNKTIPHSFNGVVLVAKKGKIVYFKAHGFADTARTIPLRTGHAFAIGSISKQITATLVLQQVAKGKLQLNAPVRRYLPGTTAGWPDSVTLHQLLCHSAGVQAWDKPLAFTPGSKFAYSNFGYIVLGEIAAQAAGQPFEQLASDLFHTCGMLNTFVPVKDQPDPRLAGLVTGSTEQPGGALFAEVKPYEVVPGPSGGMIGQARDLLQWNRYLHNGKLLPDSLYQQMTTRAITRVHRWGDMGYGYGVQVDIIGGVREISHNGYIPGFIATDIYYPGQQISIIVLENTAWDSKDMSRAFYFHDELRRMVRERWVNVKK